MAFQLKTIGELFGMNEELSQWGRPVFYKDLESITWFTEILKGK